MSNTSEHRVIKMYRKFSSKPFGKQLFSKFVCYKAPYFGSISPTFTALEHGFAEVTIRNRHKVRNHIGTVHAIAMCNMAELAGGTMTEVSIPRTMRWIPKGMKVEYLKKAESKYLRAKASFINDIVDGEKHDLNVNVDVLDDNNAVVCRCIITMFVSPKI